MVSSHSINHCEGNSSSDSASESITCPTKLCDCVQIVGHDHLKSKRARRFRCKNKRIRQLAEPKNFNQKYCDEVMMRNTKTAVEIVRPNEEQLPMRIKMLSYPKVRKLISSRDTYKSLVERERFENLIRRSMLTMYSRLANVHPPCESKQEKWTKADWERHCEWLKTRALPKMPKSPPPAKSGKKVPIQQLLMSMYALSRPRHPSQKYRPRCGYVSTVKASAQVYMPSERVLQLALPKVKDADDDDSDPFQIKPEALKAKPSKRILRLAVPKAVPKVAKEVELTDFGVIKRALQAQVKPRTLELAKPKEKADDDEDDAEKPLVNPKALKAKATPRILELAKPRVVPETIKA